MNFNSNYVKKWDIKQNFIVTNYTQFEYEFISHKFLKFFIRFKNKKIFIYWLIAFHTIKCLLSKDIFKILKLIFKYLFKNKNSKIKYSDLEQAIFHIFRFDNKLQNTNSFHLNKRKKRMPKKIKKLKFVIRKQIGPILILNKEKTNIILKNKYLKKLYKYSSNLFAPEEFFFYTLYINLLYNNEEISINPLVLNINENEISFLYNEPNGGFFLRRVTGKESINEINQHYFN